MIHKLALLGLLVGGCGASGHDQINLVDLAIEDPVDAILNGADRASATTFWRSNDGPNLFVVALFADHTGVDASICTSTLSPITWEQLSPVNIAVTGACSVPSITSISGSVSSGHFTAKIGGFSSTWGFSIAGGNL